MIFQMKTIENLWFLEIDQSSFKDTVPVTETLLAYRLQLYQRMSARSMIFLNKP